MNKVYDHPDFDSQHLLLTPGPLTTSKTVRAAMVKDWGTWEDDYNKGVIQVIRQKLVSLATVKDGYTAVLMQGSGTMTVESVLGTFMPKSGGKVLIVINGVYGKRMVQIAECLGIDYATVEFDEILPIDLEKIETAITNDITHLAMVHCEITTGALNPVKEVVKIAKSKGKITMVDAMSSFGGVPLDMANWGIDILVSSSNKCIQGVPGFAFVIADKKILETCEGNSRSVSLDLYDQWKCMEDNNGKWRFTSPTQVANAFHQALIELEDEGGIAGRNKRYTENQRILAEGMEKIGFKTIISSEIQSPIITTFYSPESADYDFKKFYDLLKQDGFILYPGKLAQADCFRIGNIGEVYPDDIKRLLSVIEKNMYWI